MQYTPVCIVFWTYALILCAHSSSCKGSVTHAQDEMQDDCDDFFKVKQLQNQSSGEMYEEKECIDFDDEDDDLIKSVSCLIYPGNIVNCCVSPFCVSECRQTFTASVTVCGNSEQNSIMACLAASEVTEVRIECQGKVEDYVSSVILLVNVSFPQTLYHFKYEYKDIEVLRPPPDISVSAGGGALLVTWNVPFSRSSNQAHCFDYQLKINNQTRTIMGKLNYTEPNRDPALGYNVTMRTKTNSGCPGSSHWSEWSDIVGLEPSPLPYELNYLVIVCISLGIPMVLLALLLLVRPQRVIKLIFPPIPHPPLKIKHLLDKDAGIEFPSTVQTYMEDITNVDHIEETPETATLA